MTTLFVYAARDEAGGAARGSIAASSREAALAHLRTRKLWVTAIAPQSSMTGALQTLRRGFSPRRDRLAFFLAFSSLMAAGVPATRGIEVCIAQCTDGAFAETLKAVKASVEGGLSLSEAFRRHPTYFYSGVSAAVAAGELAGALDSVLARIATTLERDDAARKRFTSALIYPAAVCVCAVMLLGFLMSSIVPMFESLYTQLHAPLPLVTKMLLRAGFAIRSPWGVVLLCIAGGGATAIGLLGRTMPAVSEAIDKLALQIPLVGALLRKASMARCARFLGLLLSCGVNVSRALEASACVAGNRVFAGALRYAEDSITKGAALSDALAGTALREPLLLQFVRAGEESGSVDVMLLRAADYYERELENGTAAFTAAIEPALTLVLGACVAFIAGSVLIPLYSLIGTIK